MNRRERRRRAKLQKRRRSAAAAPPKTEAPFNDALVHQNEGRLGEAEILYRQILETDPGHADSLNQLGVVLARTDRHAEGARLIAKAVALAPGEASYHNNHGIVLTHLGRPDEALECYREALAREPDNAQTLNNLGAVLKALRRPDEAAVQYQRALALRPDFAEAYSNYGNVLMDLERVKDAVSCQRQALRLNPRYAVAHNNLGSALKRLGRHGEAAASFRRALDLAPGYDDALNNLGEVLKERGEAAEAMTFYQRARAAAPAKASFHSNHLLAMNSVAGLDRDSVFAEHRLWGERHAAPLAPPDPLHDNDPDPERVLRVGYVSADLRRHSVAYFIEPVLRSHDRSACLIHCYSGVVREDEVTGRLRRHADRWRRTHQLGDGETADLVRRDGIDILVDLAGHTMNNRLLVFARKPAPVQVTWLGYPNTSGLDAMDYRLTDTWADPRNDGDQYHTERLVRLAGGFLCYRPPGDAPQPQPPAAAAPVTFGSCNNLAKVTPRVIAVWAAILKRVADSRLLLKSKPLADEDSRRRVQDLFAGHGIAAERLEMMGWVASASHLAVYDRIDIALDPFPYGGTTTTCEAMWMGVPVVTLAGDRHSGRVGLSLLGKLDLDDLAASSPEDYVERAVALAGDRTRLGALRGDLRARMERSGLTDAKTFTEKLEAAYRRMWRHWCASHDGPPPKGGTQRSR